MNTIDAFINSLNRPGAWQGAQWETTARPARAYKGTVLSKVTRATVRTGVAYANLAQNADRVTGSLPWGEWSVFPYVVAHKGDLYGRLYADRDSVRSTFYADGVEVDADTWYGFQAPSARRKRADGDGPVLTLTVRLDRLTIG